LHFWLVFFIKAIHRPKIIGNEDAKRVDLNFKKFGKRLKYEHIVLTNVFINISEKSLLRQTDLNPFHPCKYYLTNSKYKI